MATALRLYQGDAPGGGAGPQTGARLFRTSDRPPPVFTGPALIAASHPLSRRRWKLNRWAQKCDVADVLYAVWDFLYDERGYQKEEAFTR